MFREGKGIYIISLRKVSLERPMIKPTFTHCNVLEKSLFLLISCKPIQNFGLIHINFIFLRDKFLVAIYIESSTYLLYSSIPHKNMTAPSMDRKMQFH